jgi:hypothetical protein
VGLADDPVAGCAPGYLTGGHDTTLSVDLEQSPTATAAPDVTGSIVPSPRMIGALHPTRRPSRDAADLPPAAGAAGHCRLPPSPVGSGSAARPGPAPWYDVSGPQKVLPVIA